MEYRNFKNFSPVSYIHDLIATNFAEVLSSADPNLAANCFLSILLDLVNKHAP